jgi:hypothetical protein
MRFYEREVPEYEPQLLTHEAPNALDDGVGAATVGALEVAVLGEGNGSVAWAERMISLIDRNYELR